MTRPPETKSGKSVAVRLGVHQLNTATEEVEDFRKSPRFIVEPPIRATLNGEVVEIYNIGEWGIQFEGRTRPLRGSYAELRFALPLSERVVRLEGRIAWCRQATKRGTLDWPYRCGLRVEGLSAFTIESLAHLLRARVVRPDRDSLERKKQLARQQRLLSAVDDEPASTPPPVSLDDAIARVQEARAVLRGHADLLTRHAKTGRAACTERGASLEVVAVWDYLGRVVDPAIIAVVLDLYPV